MKFSARLLLSLVLIFFSLPRSNQAIASQLPPKKGIHLLSPEEVKIAAELINHNQNQGGYITIPLRTDDLEVEKWRRFFRFCQRHQLTPLIRLATSQEKNGWRQPTKKDIVDFTNFLNRMPWPQGPRHLIAFNEPNHALEWGGEVDPTHYTTLLEFTARWFHTERNKNYFILPAGLDAAAPNSPTTMDSFDFLAKMSQANPEVFDLLDGWTSHSYPNPGFASPPDYQGKNSIHGFKHELAFIKNYTDKNLPIYITETGWRQTLKNQKQVSRYYQTAFQTVWSDNQIAAVTPFLLQAFAGPFQSFSLLNPDGTPTPAYQTLQKM